MIPFEMPIFANKLSIFEVETEEEGVEFSKEYIFCRFSV